MNQEDEKDIRGNMIKDKDNAVLIAGMVKDIVYIQKDIEYIKSHFATQEVLVPIANDVAFQKKILFYFLSAVGAIIIGAVMKLILKV